MRNNKNKGFTLIELLIVIAIIGILAAVLIPNLMNARTQANERAAQAHSTNVYTAFTAALASDSQATTTSLVETYDADCDKDDSHTVGEGIDSYDYNAAPATVSSCTVAANGDDFTVTVETPNFLYVNGVREDKSGS